jgi:hypothetical protein
MHNMYMYTLARGCRNGGMHNLMHTATVLQTMQAHTFPSYAPHQPCSCCTPCACCTTASQAIALLHTALRRHTHALLHTPLPTSSGPQNTAESNASIQLCLFQNQKTGSQQ